MNERSSLSVGSLVIARRTTGVCDVGERGVCDEAYSLPDGKGGRLTERRQPPAAQPLAMHGVLACPTLATAGRRYPCHVATGKRTRFTLR
jgi:hypothetical protein